MRPVDEGDILDLIYDFFEASDNREHVQVVVTKPDDTHFCLSTDENLPSAFLMHEDEFGDMFSHSLTQDINRAIESSKQNSVRMNIYVEVL